MAKPRLKIIEAEAEPHEASRSEDAGDATPVQAVEYAALLSILCGASALGMAVAMYYVPPLPLCSPGHWSPPCGLETAPQAFAGAGLVWAPALAIRAGLYGPAKVRIWIEHIRSRWARILARFAWGTAEVAALCVALFAAFGPATLAPLLRGAQTPAPAAVSSPAHAAREETKPAPAAPVAAQQPVIQHKHRRKR